MKNIENKGYTLRQISNYRNHNNVVSTVTRDLKKNNLKENETVFFCSTCDPCASAANVKTTIAAAKLILDLESSFVKDKELPSVLAIGFIEGLGSTNVIPDKVKLKGTLRAMDEDFRATAHKRMQKIALEIAKYNGLEIDFDIRKGYPSLVNDVALTESAIVLVKEYLGTEYVIDLPIRMTAEDFAYYSHQVPSCFYRLGTRNEQKGIVHGLHTSRFNIDEQSLKIGMGLMAYLAIKN